MDGRKVKGVVEAADSKSAVAALADGGLFATDVFEKGGGAVLSGESWARLDSYLSLVSSE